jgi:hypothetical protein
MVERTPSLSRRAPHVDEFASDVSGTGTPSIELTPRSQDRRSSTTQSLDEVPSPRDDLNVEEDHVNEEEIFDEDYWVPSVVARDAGVHDEVNGMVDDSTENQADGPYSLPLPRRMPKMNAAEFRVPLSPRELQYQLTQPPGKWAPDALRTWLKEYFSEARFRDRGFILGENSFESGLSGFDAIRMSKEEWREEVGATGLEASKIARELKRLQADGVESGLDAERRSVSRRRENELQSNPENSRWQLPLLDQIPHGNVQERAFLQALRSEYCPTSEHREESHRRVDEETAEGPEELQDINRGD